MRLLVYLFAYVCVAAATDAWTKSLELGNVAWARARRNSSFVRIAHGHFLNAWVTSNETAFEAFWEATRVAVVGCLHDVVPPRAVVHAELLRELSTTASRSAPEGHTLISQLVATTLLEPADFLLVSRAWARAFDDGERLPERALTETGRIRVCYVSGHFGDHPVGHHVGALLRLHDRAAFYVICISLRADDGSSTHTDNAASCDEFHVVDHGAKARDVALAIAAVRADIIVSLDGYDSGHRMDSLSFRPSPIIVSFFGFLQTTGATYIDFVVGDAVSTPVETEKFFTERVLRHPRSFFVTNYQALHPEIVGARDTRRERASNFSFCSFVQLWKVSSDVASTWGRILASTVTTKLLLFNYPPISQAGFLASHAQLKNYFEDGRIHFIDILPRNEHLLYKRENCDLGLDTTPYNGHTSTADLLWAGVPVLAIMGDNLAGRATASLVTEAGAPPSFITHTMDEYALRAIEIASTYTAAADAARTTADDIDAAGDATAATVDVAAADINIDLLWRPSQLAPLFDRESFTRGFEGVLREALESK